MYTSLRQDLEGLATQLVKTTTDASKRPTNGFGPREHATALAMVVDKLIMIDRNTTETQTDTAARS